MRMLPHIIVDNEILGVEDVKGLQKRIENLEAALKKIQENSLECDKCSASLFAEQALGKK